MKKIFVCTSLTLILILSSCFRSREVVATYLEDTIALLEANNLNEGELSSQNDSWHNGEQYKTIEFIALPNGTLLDTRIPLNIADTILRRFEAIENGDVSAFRATFMGHDFEDGSAISMHLDVLVHFFGDMVEPVLAAEVNDGGERWQEAVATVLRGEFPPIKRNMWASVEKIEIIEVPFEFGDGHGFGIRASLLSYKSEIVVYYMGMDLVPSKTGFRGGLILFLEWIEEWLHEGRNPCCLGSCSPL